MGTLIFFFGFFAMIASFVVALIQYNKLRRMELTVVCFMLSLAVMVGGVTASVLDGAFRRQELEQGEASGADRKKAEEPSSAPVLYVSWDESLYGGGTSGEAAEPPAEPPEEQLPGEQPPEEAQPAEQGAGQAVEAPPQTQT